MSEPGFRTMLWPAKDGNIMVKHLDDEHLQRSILLMQKLHIGARKERTALVSKNKSLCDHLEINGVDHEETLNFVRDKMRIMNKWIKTLKKERSYRKHKQITVGKGSIIMPTGMTRMLETRRTICDNKAFDPDDPNLK